MPHGMQTKIRIDSRGSCGKHSAENHMLDGPEGVGLWGGGVVSRECESVARGGGGESDGECDAGGGGVGREDGKGEGERYRGDVGWGVKGKWVEKWSRWS